MRFLNENLTVDDILFHRDQLQKGDRVSVHYRLFDGSTKYTTGTIVRNNNDTVLVREDGTDVIHRYDIDQVDPEYVSESPNLDSEDTSFDFAEDLKNFIENKPSRFKYLDPEKLFTFDAGEVFDMFDIGHNTGSDYDGFPDDDQIYKAYLRTYFDEFCKLNGLMNTGSFYKYCYLRNFDEMFDDYLDSSIPTRDDLCEWAKDNEDGWE